MDRKALRLTAVTIVVAWTLYGCAMGSEGPSTAAVAAEADADAGIDVGFFYDRLAPYGDWVQFAPYGWCWSPYNTPVGWRPYTDGRWVYTDDYGWTWDSDWDWGWACFHYGRWVSDDDLGWLWVPGYEWGPAWVAWRSGPGYVGWAPLPPEVRWRAGVGLELGHFDLDRDIPHRHWVFVPDRFFDGPALRRHVLLPSGNAVVLEHTHNATRIEIAAGHIVDFGIEIGDIEKATGRPVPHFHLRSVGSVAAAHLPREHHDEIDMFRPRVRPGPAGLRPPLPFETDRRYQLERGQMEERHQAEQAFQQQRHEAERREEGVNREELQHRQEAERQALRDEQQRQLRQLDHRQQRERQRFQPQRERRSEGEPQRREGGQREGQRREGERRQQ
jgi:hypothetical protein